MLCSSCTQARGSNRGSTEIPTMNNDVKTHIVHGTIINKFSVAEVLLHGTYGSYESVS